MPQLIDGNIPASVKPPPSDPLATIGSLTAIQQGQLQNRMLGQQVGSREAFGRILQGATGSDGQVNIGDAMTGVSADPEASFMAPEFATQLQQLGALQAQTQAALARVPQAQLEAFQANAAPIEGVIRGLVQNSQNAPLTKEYATASLTRDLKDQGLLKTPEAQQLFEAEISQLTDDPQHNLAVLTSNGVRLGGPLEAYVGAPTAMNTGGQVNIVQTPAIGGGGPVTRGSLPLSLSPGEAAAPTPVMVRNPDGSFSPSTVPLATYGEMAKQGPVASGPALTAQGLTPSEANELVTVTDSSGQQHLVPKSSLVGGGTSAGAGPGNGRYPSGGANVGLPPGQADTMAASAKVYQDDLAAVPALRQTMTTFDQARTALANAPTGVGSDKLQALRGLAETYGIPLPQGVKDDAVAYAETNKWLSSALTQEAGRLGLNTDQARALQAEAQPSAHTVHDAAVQMLPILQGLKAMQLAAPVLAQAQGVTPQQYAAWRASWANSVDPLAFSASQYTQAQRAAMAKRMTAQEKGRYINGLKAAVDAGVFSREDLAR